MRSGGEVPHHVTFSFPPGALTDRVIGGFCRPETEAVVMLGGEDYAAHPGRCQRPHDGVRVERRRVEETGIFVSIPPFLIGERVDREMQESRSLEFMPAHLAGRGNGAIGARPWG